MIAFLAVVSTFLPLGFAWSPTLRRRVALAQPRSQLSSLLTEHKRPPTLLGSTTPFEADFYAPDEDSDGTAASPLAVNPDTRLVVGLNKYSHDTSLCAANAETGEVLWALSKERLTRRKHDSGTVTSLVESCLESLNLPLENIVQVVMNNHHHRILPLETAERHMEWEAALGINGGRHSDLSGGYDEPENTLSHAPRRELSHHLAHAYSTATQAPFDAGLCVVMDGMGETYRTMRQAMQTNDTTYVSDLSFGLDSFQCVPSNIDELASHCPFDYREAESVYRFQKCSNDDGEGPKIDIWPVFKRFTRENSPPTLFNHGFENMDSLGAVYSRASSHIFSDWNSCGKVMGLAPWMDHQWTVGNAIKTPIQHEHPTMWGKVYSEEADEELKLNRTLLEGEPCCRRNDPDLFNPIDGTMKKRYDFDDAGGPDPAVQTTKPEEPKVPAKVDLDAISLAYRVQQDLETVGMDLVRHLKEETGEINLCLAGGVALNSVLNGRLTRELGFNQTFVSPYPGDDGIAVGCCALGLFGNKRLDLPPSATTTPVWSAPLTPYLGPSYTEQDIREAIEEASPWLDVEIIRNANRRLEMMALEISTGGVVAWYQSRSEMGPRALGHRSLLADPRKKGLVRFINEKVKRRETFRPFAPSVLAEHAAEWFEDMDYKRNISPYMSLTASVRSDKRAEIPAVTHVDGSSRLQTVTEEAEPLYYKLLQKFFERTGVPIVLNTSFNTMPREPIVESPRDAIRSFLYSMGSIEMLVMEDYVIQRKPPNLRHLLGQISKDGDTLEREPAYPVRAGPATLESSFTLSEDEEDESNAMPNMRVKMPDRPLHAPGNEWFELLDELEGELLSVCDGKTTVNDVLAHYTEVEDNESGDTDDGGQDRVADAESLLQNIVHRLVRLYEHTLIQW